MNELEIFKNRLKKIDIDIELVGNYPWIYLHKVNGNIVKTEDWINANHGYTIAWYPIKPGDSIELNWYDIKETFKLLRKYR